MAKAKGNNKVTRNINIENAKIILRNFSGKEKEYNPEGQRNFGVLLSEEIAGDLEREGWNVRYLKPTDPEDNPQPWLPVKISYKSYPPKVTLIKASGMNILDENEIHILDWADIRNVDLILRPYNWDVNGKQGVKAYLKVMYITVEEDFFEQKYRGVPDLTEIDDDEPPWE